MAHAQAASGRPKGRQQRHLRNYLLDARFQLKYAAYFSSIAVVLSLGLGSVLWITNQALLSASAQLVDRGRAVVVEGQKVSRVVEMNIVKDPEYGQDKELQKVFHAGDKQYSAQLEGEQAKLERDAQAITRQNALLWWTLVGSLTLFVVLVALAGVLVTHRVAGPLFKMKRQLSDVSEGKLSLPGSLRRGDDLVEFFSAFDSMVRRLRTAREQDVAVMDDCLAKLERNDLTQLRETLEATRQQKKASLET